MGISFSALGTVGGPDFNPRTMSQAAVAAESAASASARGRRIKCNRGRGWMSTAECVALYRAGQDDPDGHKDCSRDLGCSAGRMRAANFKEDDMGKSNYGKCIECGRTGNRDSAGRCYHAACKKTRGKTKAEASAPAPAAAPATAVGPDAAPDLMDDLTPRESPILDADEVAATGADSPTFTQDEHTEDIDESTAEGVASTPDHLGDATKIIDFTRPFSFSGFDFDPGTPPPPPGRPIARLAPSGNLSISSAATHTHNLTRFKFLQIIPDKTGLALALIFLAEATGGARKLAPERKSGASLKVSAEAIARVAPGLVGKALELRPMGQDGAFVAVAVEEAA